MSKSQIARLETQGRNFKKAVYCMFRAWQAKAKGNTVEKAAIGAKVGNPWLSKFAQTGVNGNPTVDNLQKLRNWLEKQDK